MRKWLFITVFVLAAFAGTAFLLSPHAETTTSSTLQCSNLAVDRFLLNRQSWKQWWPGEMNDENLLSFQSYRYRIDQLLSDGFVATVMKDNDSARLVLHVEPAEQNSSLFSWTREIASYHNPVYRTLASFTGGSEIASNLEKFITAVNAFFNSQEKVYGMTITLQKVKNSSLISTRRSFDHFPSTPEIYDMIGALKQYIRQKGGVEKDAPMLNVHEADGRYETMVAIPTQRDLPSEGSFQLKKMVLGNILVAEVKGGVSRVKQGEEELQHYVNDYRKTAPAIPFQSLITDRQEQPDSNQWVTRLNYPVFY